LNDAVLLAFQCAFFLLELRLFRRFLRRCGRLLLRRRITRTTTWKSLQKRLQLRRWNRVENGVTQRFGHRRKSMKRILDHVTPKLQEGKLGYILLWALGVPIPVLFAIYLLRGCT
jgi:hypothetical protein